MFFISLLWNPSISCSLFQKRPIFCFVDLTNLHIFIFVPHKLHDCSRSELSLNAVLNKSENKRQRHYLFFVSSIFFFIEKKNTENRTKNKWTNDTSFHFFAHPSFCQPSTVLEQREPTRSNAFTKYSITLLDGWHIAQVTDMTYSSGQWYDI